MIAQSDTETDAKYSDNFSVNTLTDKTSETIESSATPLARNHWAQKHHYPTDKYNSNNIIETRVAKTNIAQTHMQQISIDCQSASLAVEAAVAIVINGIHYAVLMASPHQLEYLAVGFLSSEGLIQHSHELLDWEVTQLNDIADYQNLTQDSFIKERFIRDATDEIFESAAF